MRPFRIKFCGFTQRDDALAALGLGACALGLNQVPQSPRCLSLATLETMIRALRAAGAGPLVGIYVQPGWSELQTGLSFGLDVLQLYEPDYVCLAPHLAAAKCPIILARGVADAADMQQLMQELQLWEKSGVRVLSVLIDAKVAGQQGGTGQQAPWEMLQTMRPKRPWILAGGLHPGNVRAAIERLQPNAVDVASGIESSPGLKDHRRMAEFMAEASQAFANLATSPPPVQI